MALHVLTGSAAPTAAPEFIGQHYIDQTNGVQYLANGTAAAGDWQKVGSAGAEAAATANSGAAYTADLSVAPLHVVTLTGNCAISLGGAPAAGTVGRVYLALRQSLGNIYTVSWPASVLLWPADTAPGAPAGGQLDRYTFETWDGGALWIAAAVERGFVEESAAWNLSMASYDSVFEFLSQDTVLQGITFSADGTRFFMAGAANDSIYQYSLATAWDLSTITYDSVSLNVTAQDANPKGITFSADGMRLFMAGFLGGAIHQYSLTTAWDLSTATYDSVSLSVATEDGSPNGIAFSTEGTRLFVVGLSGSAIYQYSLATAWDLSTATYDSVTLNVSNESQPTEIDFSADGTRMFIAGLLSNAIHQYSLATAWDLSTATYDSVTLNVGTEDGSPEGIAFSADGMRLFMAGSNNDAIYQYSLG